jgi:hypothetical protein
MKKNVRLQFLIFATFCLMTIHCLHGANIDFSGIGADPNETNSSNNTNGTYNSSMPDLTTPLPTDPIITTTIKKPSTTATTTQRSGSSSTSKANVKTTSTATISAKISTTTIEIATVDGGNSTNTTLSDGNSTDTTQSGGMGGNSTSNGGYTTDAGSTDSTLPGTDTDSTVASTVPSTPFKNNAFTLIGSSKKYGIYTAAALLTYFHLAYFPS